VNTRWLKQDDTAAQLFWVCDRCGQRELVEPDSYDEGDMEPCSNMCGGTSEVKKETVN
jgi:hypothetical protein